MSSPVVSVVMGVYNGAEYLAETIESVLCQSEGHFEFIIVNDGSTDSAVEAVLSDYKHRDERVRVLAKLKAGLTQALIDGCAAGKGKYIARIDNGDVMLPERLKTQRAVLDAHPDAVLATCWTECCGPLWEPLYTTRNVLPEEVKHDYIWKLPFPEDGGDGSRQVGPTSHPSVMMRADAYRKAGGYRSAFYYGQDWDLWYRLAECGTFAGVREVLYRCRIFPEGISMQNVERQRQIHVCSRGAFLARRRGEDETPFLERAATIRPSVKNGSKGEQKSLPADHAAGYYFIGEALRRNRDRRCRLYFRQALFCRPGNLRSWARLVQSCFGVV